MALKIEIIVSFCSAAEKKTSNLQHILLKFYQALHWKMINIACSTCLESFTSGCDISTTPCGHVFHTGCITRWLNVNIDCPQCRKGCEIVQIIKLFFSESQSAIEEQITINRLEQKSLQMEEDIQEYIQEANVSKKRVLDKSIEINQANQKCKRLEHEKLLMKLNWSKTEWNLKETINKSSKLIQDLGKQVNDKSIKTAQANKRMWDLHQEKCRLKSDLSKTEWMLIDSINKSNKQIKGLEKEIRDQKMVDIHALQFCGLDPGTMIGKNKSGFKRNHEDYLITTNSGFKQIRKDFSITIINESIDCIPEIINNLTRIQNRLRVGITSTYVLYNDYRDFWEYYLRKLSTLPSNANYEGHFAKLEMWLNILNNMNIDLPKFGQLTNDQHEQMSIDFNDAFNDLKERSNNSNVCTSCEENLTGSYQCTDCDETLCVKCFKAHSRLKLTRTHTVTPL